YFSFIFGDTALMQPLPRIDVAEIDFGSSLSGTNAIRPFRIDNDGLVPLEIQSIATAADDELAFGLSRRYAGLTIPLTILPGGYFEFEVELRADELGHWDTVMEIVTNSTATPVLSATVSASVVAELSWQN